MRHLWIAGISVILASTLVASASASPVRFSQHLRVDSIQRSQSGACGSLPSGTSILPDGDFSQAANPGNDTGVGPGTVFAPDWTSAGPRTVDFYGIGSGVPWAEPAGLCSVDLDGTPGPGSIQHAPFPTQPGDKYVLSFLFSGNDACRPTIKKMEVRVGRVSKRFRWDVSGGNSAQNGNWTPETVSFMAVRTTTKLEFISRDRREGNCGPAVAGISVTLSP
jgi:Protein of unknown function (DUF642)